MSSARPIRQKIFQYRNDGANQFLDSQYDQYDQAKVSRQDVITALKVFQDQNIAVVVLTQGEIKMQSAEYNTGTVYNALNYNAVLTSGKNPTPNAVDLFDQAWLLLCLTELPRQIYIDHRRLYVNK